MLLSMTGFGEARASDHRHHIWVELRSVNSKYFKCSIRTPEGWGQLEPLIEQYIRERVRRGTLQLLLRVESLGTASGHAVNADVVQSYLRQLQPLLGTAALAPMTWGDLLGLPGCIVESSLESYQIEETWPLVRQVLDEALTSMDAMRTREGSGIAADLAEHCKQIENELLAIRPLTEQAAADCREKMLVRMGKALADSGVEVNGQDLLREVAFLVDRADISEEVARLQMHIDHFRRLMVENDSKGRQLEFVTQEMFREANTIGSKASHALISVHVVAIKTSVERLREMIQNVE